MKTADLDYQLPPDLIAQSPAEPRDQSRLLVLHRDGGRIEHRLFRDVREYFQAGDVLVLNDSRVIPARLRGRKLGSGGAVEVLLLEPQPPDVWLALIRPGRRVHEGTIIEFERGQPLQSGARESAGPQELRAEVLENAAGGIRRLQFSIGGEHLSRSLEAFGDVPLPPYIHTPLTDPERYQTVYAKPRGSVAAPTAGLHFTPELLQDIVGDGIQVLYVTVHIGLHTFRPIQVEEVEQHQIHREHCLLSPAVAEACNSARAAGGRIFAVGTSSVRVLESAWSAGQLQPFDGWADLYIYPGYTFRAVDAMLTNFHLPKTTLLSLVSAFAAREQVLAAYQEAIDRRYRFYSFGDACLLL